MAKEYIINGRKVKMWFRRGGARIPIYEDGGVGKNQNKKEKYDHIKASEDQLKRLNEWEDVYDIYDKQMQKANEPSKALAEDDEFLNKVWEHHLQEAQKRGLTPDEYSKQLTREGIAREGRLVPIDPYKPKEEAENILKGKSITERAREIDKVNNNLRERKYDEAVKKGTFTEKEAKEMKNYEKWQRGEISSEDYNKVNEKTTFNFGKVDAYGTGKKSNEITVEAQIKDGVFTASGNVWNSKHTDIISGGQNLDELKGYLKGNKEFENVYNMWKKHHLNDMHAGTIKQEEALNKKFGGVNANKYEEQVDYLKSVGLYEDEGYKFGTGWLKRDIPEEDMKNIVDTIRRNNSSTSNGASLAKMSESELRQMANQYGLKSEGLSKKQLMAQLISVFNK